MAEFDPVLPGRAAAQLPGYDLYRISRKRHWLVPDDGHWHARPGPLRPGCAVPRPCPEPAEQWYMRRSRPTTSQASGGVAVAPGFAVAALPGFAVAALPGFVARARSFPADPAGRNQDMPWFYLARNAA